MYAQNSELGSELGTEVIGEGRFEELLDAFQDAFSDYLIDVTMDGQKLRKMLRRRSVDLRHSISLVEGRRILGFVLNGIRDLGGVKTGYDAGTGVRPDHRGGGLGRRLLEDTHEHLRAIGADRYLLEVLAENRAAIALYESAGFEVYRQLRCFKATNVKLHEDNSRGVVTRTIPLHELPWRSLRSLRLFDPSWQNNMEFLVSPGATVAGTGQGTEEAAEEAAEEADSLAIVAEDEGRIEGFVVCDADGGEILDLGLPSPAVGIGGTEDPDRSQSRGSEEKVFSFLLEEIRSLWANSNHTAGKREANTEARGGTDSRGTEVLGTGTSPGDRWELQFLNVDTASLRALSLLDRFGFESFVDQYEMSRAL